MENIMYANLEIFTFPSIFLREQKNLLKFTSTTTIFAVNICTN